jgi:hypothetical protein
MSLSVRAVAPVACAMMLAGTLAACGQNVAGNAVAAAAGTPAGQIQPPAPPAFASADPTKTGEAYASELEHDPALFEKQKQICRGNGPSFQPTPELQSACAAWDIARRNLEIDQPPQGGGVKNTDTL